MLYSDYDKYHMIFKSSYQILNNPWKQDTPNIDPNPKMTPPYNNWDCKQPITFDDVKLWEQIFYMPGNLGVYGAWDPYAEFYVIVYNLFANEPYGIETFIGPSASNEIAKKLISLGIDISTKEICFN